eukprot:3475918-Prymnesium_polylepis.1
MRRPGLCVICTVRRVCLCACVGFAPLLDVASRSRACVLEGPAATGPCPSSFLRMGRSWRLCLLVGCRRHEGGGTWKATGSPVFSTERYGGPAPSD